MKIKLSAIIALFVLLTLIFILIVIVIPLLGIANSKTIVAQELDNQYINNSYDNWESVTLFETFSLQVPECWQFHRNGDIYYITDEKHTRLGYCTIIQKNNTQFQDTEMVLADLVEFEIVDIDWEYLSNIKCIGNSDFSKLDVRGLTQTMRFYRLKLSEDENSKCLFLFEDNEELDLDELIKISEAIVYSYVFRDT